MNFLTMEYFLSIAEHRNITKAAAELHITQQTLSAHLTALEKELDTKLFIRSSPMELTHVGTVFLKHAAIIFENYQSMWNEFNDLTNNQRGKLMIGINAITARVVYDRFDIDLMQEESPGIQKLFGILCPIIDIMTNGKVLICDELESSLHESLVFGLVKLFMNTQTDKFAQMIFTTHETGLLNLDLFRRDQIWFAEMRKDDRSTDLYSLAEIKNVRKEDNFGRGYISGKYGAIPMLNLNFADIVSEA